MGQEVCECDPLLVETGILYQVIIMQGLGNADRFEKLDQDFSEDVVVFNLSTDHECKWYEVRVGSTFEVLIFITCWVYESGNMFRTAITLIRFDSGSPAKVEGLGMGGTSCSSKSIIFTVILSDVVQFSY